jgi:hypothetical protein
VAGTMARDPGPVVRLVRDRIDPLVDRDRRRSILNALGCFELHGDKTRRRDVPKTADGAELLAAIDALDHACLQGGDGEIEAAGARLIALWGLLMNAPSQTPRSCVFLCRDYRPGVAGLDLGDPPERRSRGRTG